MTAFDDQFKDLPYKDITVRLYNVGYPIKVEGSSKHYFTTFRYGGSTVRNDKGQEVGNVSSPFGGGMYLQFHFTNPETGHRDEWYLPPDDIWNLLREQVGFEIPDDTGEEIIEERPREKPKKALDYDIFDDDDSDEVLEAKALAFRNAHPEEFEEDDLMKQDLEYSIEDSMAQDVTLPPDFSRGATTFGGHLKDIPLPHVRYWPGSFKKKEVRIRIMRYYGAGGVHYYASLQEDSNPIWNSAEGYWQEAWDDLEGKGRDEWGIDDWPNRLRSYQLTKLKIQEILAREFPPEAYEYVWDDMTDERIEKEGD